MPLPLSNIIHFQYLCSCYCGIGCDKVVILLMFRYPTTPEEFRRSRLPGVFDSTRAGKRMKLPTPETWETQVSMKGNKAATWESLIGI